MAKYFDTEKISEALIGDSAVNVQMPSHQFKYYLFITLLYCRCRR